MKGKSRLGLGLIMGMAAAAAVLLAAKTFLRKPRVSPEEARRLVANGATLVDVRTPGEFADGHLPGALNVPVLDIDRRSGEIPRHRPVIVYCASGMRSASAAEALRSAGWSEVHDLGAMSRWRE